MGKRVFDIVFAFIGLVLMGWFIVVCFIIVSVDTKSFGLFIQKRVGQYGKLFSIYKLKTITINSEGNHHISNIGRLMRKTKVDEFPQLINVLFGNMSFVGPRPDIAGYYDLLTGKEREVLKLKPGITGPASLKYKNEEELLKRQANQADYNDNVIFPDKVKINLWYQKNRSVLLDFKIIVCTIFNLKLKGVDFLSNN